MRRFNPERELRKIKHGNRNKIVFSVIALLLIIAIGSSYALYQVGYSKRIIYTKVRGFSKVTFILPEGVSVDPSEALLLSGETKIFTATLPDNYKIDTVTCTNSDVTDITENTFKLVYTTSKASECTVTIKEKKPKSLLEICNSNELLNKCLAKGEQVDNIFADDPDQNIRYAGPSDEVYNYIWFNCDDYDFTSAEEAASKNCEKWRIIGLFKNITKTEGGTDNLVKIIRADSVGDLGWNSPPFYYNSWTTSSLQESLNVDYLNPNDSGTYTSSSEIRAINATTLEMIEEVTWNVGGEDETQASAQEFYAFERGSTTYKSNSSTWDGYIGLMYPSDYGYATTGSNQMGKDRAACLTSKLVNYNASYCSERDWLYIIGANQWTLTPSSTSASRVFHISRVGDVDPQQVVKLYSVRPSLYLKSSVKIMDGNGSSETPYILVP